jgi:hypothetical protein
MDATPAGSPRLYSSDVAFTPSVKAIQARRGSRKAYAQREEAGGHHARLSRFHRPADQRFSRHGEQARPALHSAPRRPAGLFARAR